MYRKRCDLLRGLAAVGLGTLVALYCPTRVLIVLLSLSVIILAVAMPRN